MKVRVVLFQILQVDRFKFVDIVRVGLFCEGVGFIVVFGSLRDSSERDLLGALGLLNDKGQLVNRQGQRVDVEGNLLDEEGARIDADGNRIDINNNPLLDDSVVDELEFEDDLAEDIEKEEKPPKKSRASAKKKEADAK